VKARKDTSLKPLTPKQLERLRQGYKLEGGEIPPWYKATNKNTTRDLKRITVYQILDAIDQALQTGKHREQLEAIRSLAKRAETAFNAIAESTKRDPKYRERLGELVAELEISITDLEHLTGFDLHDKETW
jgi:hypothetical protein